MRISDWSSDVCSSDLGQHPVQAHRAGKGGRRKIYLRLGGDGGRNAGTKAYLPKAFDLLMRIGPVEGYRNISHRAHGRFEFYAPYFEISDVGRHGSDRKSTRLNSSH